MDTGLRARGAAVRSAAAPLPHFAPAQHRNPRNGSWLVSVRWARAEARTSMESDLKVPPRCTRVKRLLHGATPSHGPFGLTYVPVV